MREVIVCYRDGWEEFLLTIGWSFGTVLALLVFVSWALRGK